MINMRLRYNIINISEWNDTNDDVTGARKKFWAVAPDGERWLFKIPKQNSKEHLMEKLAYELSLPIRNLLPHAETQLAQFQGIKGSISKSVLTGLYNCDLVEFKTLVKSGNGWSSASTRRGRNLYRKYGREYNVEIVDETIYKLNNQLVVYFIRAILFDYLIGNRDRHHGNWGLIECQKEGKVMFCPLYDSGSSLLATKPEETIIKRLNENRLLTQVNGTSSLVSDGTRNRPQFRYVLKLLRREYPEIFIQFAKEIDKHWTDEFLHSRLAAFGNLMSAERKKLMYELLRTSRNELIRRAKAPAR